VFNSRACTGGGSRPAYSRHMPLVHQTSAKRTQTHSPMLESSYDYG